MPRWLSVPVDDVGSQSAPEERVGLNLGAQRDKISLDCTPEAIGGGRNARLNGLIGATRRRDVAAAIRWHETSIHEWCLLGSP